MANSTKTAEELIAIYNEIDSFLRQQYKSDKYADHSFLVQEVSRTNAVVARYQQELRAMAQLRNSIVHNPLSVVAQPIASPHPEIIKKYRAIKDAMLNPRTALSIAIPAHNIYTASLNSNLGEVLKEMNKNIYTHVPIIKENQMVGIFSENSLLSYLAESGEVIITNDMTIGDLADYLPLASHQGECFEFLPRRASLGQVFEVFNKAIHKHQRVGMIFITEHGQPGERPLGIITAWDLASPDFELH